MKNQNPQPQSPRRRARRIVCQTLTAAQLAEVLQISVKTVYQLVKHKRLAALKNLPVMRFDRRAVFKRFGLLQEDNHDEQ